MSSVRERAISLLGDAGATQEQVALALGVEPSYISQLMGQPEFASEVANRRFTAMQKHSARDSNYDELEDAMIERFKQVMPMIIKPNEVLRAMKELNAMKRRAAPTLEQPVGAAASVVLNMPVKLVQTFQTNINNQVISVRGQDLVTISPEQLLKKAGVKDDTEQKLIEGANS